MQHPGGLTGMKSGHVGRRLPLALDPKGLANRLDDSLYIGEIDSLLSATGPERRESTTDHSTEPQAFGIGVATRPENLTDGEAGKLIDPLGCVVVRHIDESRAQ